MEPLKKTYKKSLEIFQDPSEFQQSLLASCKNLEEHIRLLENL